MPCWSGHGRLPHAATLRRTPPSKYSSLSFIIMGANDTPNSQFASKILGHNVITGQMACSPPLNWQQSELAFVSGLRTGAMGNSRPGTRKVKRGAPGSSEGSQSYVGSGRVPIFGQPWAAPGGDRLWKKSMQAGFLVYATGSYITTQSCVKSALWAAGDGKVAITGKPSLGTIFAQSIWS